MKTVFSSLKKVKKLSHYSRSLKFSRHLSRWSGRRLAQVTVVLVVPGLVVLSAPQLVRSPACRTSAGQPCYAGADMTPLAGVVELRPTPTSLFDDLPAKVASFVKLALPYAFQAHQALGWQTSVILAQWGLEQGWHVPSYTGYNWGNVGLLPGVPSVPGLNVPGSPSGFSYAATPADGEHIYVMGARLPYYIPVTQAVPAGPDATAVALGRSPWDAGHYTNIGQPGSSLLALMHSYNLYRFDGGDWLAHRLEPPRWSYRSPCQAGRVSL
jgi:hypothetical protein